ncbi:manganese efflux pump MntP family protein [Sphingomonas rosea]|uniref:Putative manganese efflux pump MntP n=1 Tax=Sphingomonas rosea TaxID=335605 RepID=A0ABP7UCB3_9SPHN
MTPLAIAGLSFSMSADACAAAIGQGAVRKPTFEQAIRSGAVFGAIEAITPLIGWVLGTVAAGFITGIDHWIAFGLLGGVGGKMLWEGALKSLGRREAAVDDEAVATPGRQGTRTLVLTAIGTSIDAAAVGVTLAFLEVNILLVALAIGATTFLLTTAGLLLGGVLGRRFGGWVEMFGGLVLMTIGTIILLEHTGVI